MTHQSLRPQFMWLAVPALALAVLSGGCDGPPSAAPNAAISGQELVASVDVGLSKDEVKARLGEPTVIIPSDDGQSEMWICHRPVDLTRKGHQISGVQVVFSEGKVTHIKPVWMLVQ